MGKFMTPYKTIDLITLLLYSLTPRRILVIKEINNWKNIYIYIIWILIEYKYVIIDAYKKVFLSQKQKKISK